MADGKAHQDTDAAEIESNHDKITDSFDAMNLKTELLRGVYTYGFERPSAFQQRAIMPIIKGAVWNRQDRRLLHLRPPADRPDLQGMPGLNPCPDP
ncbi:hypothetical protein KCU67_g6476, partial [Aureobasidium melanogenum]